MAATGTARWARFASLAYRLGAAGPLVMLAGAIGWGLDLADLAGFLLVTAALYIGASFLVRSRRILLRIVGVVLGAFAALPLFWTAFGLLEPTSFFDFVPGLLVVPGSILGLVVTIAAILAQRRDDVVVAAEGGERRGMTIALGALGALALVSAVLTVSGRDTVGDDVAVDATVKLKDFEFGEDAYVLEPGAKVLVKNDDPFIHTFTIDDLDIDVKLGPSSEKVVTIPDDAASGDFILYCEPHTSDPEDPSDDDMAAELAVG